MLELLFLLLPIAAAYGWYMGRRSVYQDKQQQANRLSREYVTGVNFLLSDQQDQAVEHFLSMLKEGSSAFEAHLTLANLFRSRGEADRAIRIHQSLLESGSLSIDQRLLVTQQLGHDYMKAGLYDRAEAMFQQLCDEHDFQYSALQQLLIIYQMTSDWSKAIDVAEKLVKLGSNEYKIEIAHFYCELALQEISDEKEGSALGLLKKALQADEKCARASLMLGRLLIERCDYGQAVVVLQKILQQDRDFISEALPLLENCYQQLQQPVEWENFIQQCVNAETGVSAELLLADHLEQTEGKESAEHYITQRVQQHPTMRSFYRLMDYHLANAEEGKAKQNLLLLHSLVEEQIRSKPRYRCQKCGFTINTLYWHCPSCRCWATIKPIRGLDGQ